MGRILMERIARNKGSGVRTDERVVFTFLSLEPKRDHIAVPFESGSC